MKHPALPDFGPLTRLGNKAHAHVHTVCRWCGNPMLPTPRGLYICTPDQPGDLGCDRATLTD